MRILAIKHIETANASQKTTQGQNKRPCLKKIWHGN